MSKVLCLDLEGNGESGKIIQIGYVIADCVTGRIYEKRSIIVNPLEKLTAMPNNGIHISDYTGITQKMVDSGLILSDAYEILCKDIYKHNPTTTCIQWGDGAEDNKGDHDWLRRELGLSWKDFIFRPRAWDVKSQFQIYRVFNRQGVIAGVSKALKILGLEFEGKEHNALDDAMNTLRIFMLLGDKSIKYDKIKQLLK